MTTPTTAAKLRAHREEVVAPAAEFLTPDLLAVAGRLDALAGLTLPWRGPEVCIIHP